MDTLDTRFTQAAASRIADGIKDAGGDSGTALALVIWGRVEHRGQQR